MAPVDSHTAGAVGPGASVSHGTGGGEGHTGVIGPTDSHAAKGLIDLTVPGGKGVVAPVDSHGALPVDPALMQCSE